ncbi:MAG: GntR family transcriptional regulator [Longimonas sp.]|uniref:GntR family transcriptional regulator n=1 Tax=Longimonas sp. TaxID=2039626 RepID=UPI003352C92D
MLEIDRSAPTSVHDQLVEQLRYQIARGEYAIDESLPSTRRLAEQLDISFHTVRKAYKTLKEDGLLDSRVGSGYTVKERRPFEKAERMERGAEVMHGALQRLIGLGCTEPEIEALMQEQAAQLDYVGFDRKLLIAGPNPELNTLWADQISERLQQPVRACTLAALQRHEDADYVFTPYDHLHDAQQQVPRADVLGFVTHLPSRVLDRLTRLPSHSTVGLVTRRRGSIAPLSSLLRQHAAFNGQVIAASVDEGTDHLSSFIGQVACVLYTPESKRRVRTHLTPDQTHSLFQVLISTDSLDALAAAVPA